ncbi:MAG: PspC family transcriptional regulator [Weeksellaceae bacterium]|jgi:phage shock protein PspC (stress-responsive transcriptional regulator)|nr:PspC family transcriptional regulator [Weeksellaceae bacterium]MDX9705247.1 PspC family transcriptional regulator [Weeksellaceae bacterium]
MFERLRNFLEFNGFNVISRIADKLGVRASKLRLLFIYLSFVTLGVTFAFYLIFAFFLWVKDGIIVRRKSVFDL